MVRTDVAGRDGRCHIQLFAQADGMPIRWRMLGGNNRELGRSTDEFTDRESCGLHIKQLQAAELGQAVQRTPASTWMWVLSLDGLAIATSGHRYDRLIRCRQGLAHFVEQLPRCEINATVMLTQSRRWSAVSSRALAEGRGRP